ncbi:hypothetical protein D6851_00250 [Altericroceibacterium spongiae]|uniref:Uncharacterized protein n=1 Tax=Altericroceibacterium spongiae TaxID=2320269 RepID=A0A420EQM3_9SPHN|nr:hypothetical protein [Altericroceibacterium spongiae]RKF22988.1 hypothetical protein D6851_00250 [Altericroceibacterium spongiae]
MSNEVQYIIDPERINALGGSDFANPPYARFTPAPSVSAEDFSFQNTFDSLKGQTESLSVSGVTGSIDTIEKTVVGIGRDEEKEKDGISWDDVMETQERIREEIRKISVAGIEMSREELDQTIEDLSDPEKRERAAQNYATQNNTTVAKAREEIDRVSQYLLALRAIDDGKATAAQQALVTEFEADPQAKSRVERVLNATHHATAKLDAAVAAGQAELPREEIFAALAAADNASRNAIIANVEDTSIWEDAREAQGITGDDLNWTAQTRGNGDVGVLAFSDTRSGSVITPVYNEVSANAAAAPQLAQAQAPTDPVSQSNVELGMG